MYPGSPSDPSGTATAEVRILNFKTTRSEFQMPSQTAPAEVRILILKPHGQNSITSPELVQSSFVR